MSLRDFIHVDDCFSENVFLHCFYQNFFFREFLTDSWIALRWWWSRTRYWWTFIYVKKLIYLKLLTALLDFEFEQDCLTHCSCNYVSMIDFHYRYSDMYNRIIRIIRIDHSICKVVPSCIDSGQLRNVSFL